MVTIRVLVGGPMLEFMAGKSKAGRQALGQGLFIIDVDMPRAVRLDKPYN